MPEWDKVWSRLSAHFQPFFSALSAYFNDFRLEILYFNVLQHNILICNKTIFRHAKGVRLTSVTLTLAPSGSNWLSQALTGSLWLLLALSLTLSLALGSSHCGSHWFLLPLSGLLWPSLAHYFSLIIGPESDHWQCLSVTD